MNYKILEDYIKEIDHYLVIKEGRNEILNEIKSHILEKTESESGEINDNALKAIIENYGSPKMVAEKYMEDYQIISPVYKKYLFLYTGLLFVIHYGLILLSAFSNYEMVLFPFFYIPIMGTHSPVWNQLILYIPMTFFYDFGLVCLFLYFVTQNKNKIKLPWFEINLNWLIEVPEKAEEPKKHILGVMILGFAAVLFVYLRYNTLFFLTVGGEKTASAFNSAASKWLSFSVIFIYLLEILHYTSRFFSKSAWVKLIKDGIILIILWLIINYPIEEALVDFPYLNLSTIITFALLFLSIMASINFIKSLIEVIDSRKKSGSKPI